jgi:hypothetical protein
VRGQVVQNNMDFLFGIFGHDFIHEVQKFSSSTPLIVSTLHLAGSNVDSCEQGSRAVAFVS